MGPLLVASVGTAAMLGAAAWILRRRKLGSWSATDLVRLRLSVDPSWADGVRHGLSPEDAQKAVEAQVASALEGAGAGSVRLVMQDPSDPLHATWTALSTSVPSPDALPPTITLDGSEPVEKVALPKPADVPSLDQGLNEDEVWAATLAWEVETDPQRLEGFASTFDVDYPVTAGLLHAKAKLEGLAREQNASVGALRVAGRISGVPGGMRVAGILDDVADVATSVVDRLGDAAKGIGGTASDLWDKYGGVVEVMGGWVPGPTLWAVETAVKSAKAIEAGENVGGVLSSQAVRFAQGLRQAAPLVAYVPGIGQGVAVALEASALLALCGLGEGCPPIDQAAIDLAASQVPGGPITQSAFRSAASAGYGLARGEDWDQAALEGLRSGLPSDEARVAFDAGLALARGDVLTEAGFQMLRTLVGGSDLFEQGENFARSVLKSVTSGKSVKSVLLDEVASDIDALGLSGLDVREKLGGVISDLQANPELLQNFAPDLAAALGVPEPIARAALGAVQDIGNGVILVDPEVTNRLMPPIKFSNAALLAANARFRPASLQLNDSAFLSARLHSFSSDNGLLADKAQAQLARAQREIDRLNWVTWYRKAYASGFFG